MPFPQQTAQPFSRDTIELLNPGRIGVYGIFGGAGLGFFFGGPHCIYIGKGDIRDRLLKHVNGDIPEIFSWYPDVLDGRDHSR